MRRLVCDDRTFSWGLAHRHEVDPSGMPFECREVFSAYLEGYKRSPLRVIFSSDTGVHRDALARGVVVLEGTTDDERVFINLNRPKAAALLVRHGLGAGWEPTTMTQPFILQDLRPVLEALAAEARLV